MKDFLCSSPPFKNPTEDDNHDQAGSFYEDGEPAFLSFSECIFRGTKHRTKILPV